MTDTSIYQGDCRDILELFFAENHFDSIVTDPPYGLEFMGKEWDRGVPGVEFWQQCFRVLKPGGYLLAFSGTRTYHRMVCAIEDAGFEIRDQVGWAYGSGFPKSMNVANAIHDAAIGQPQGGAKPGSANSGKYKGGSSAENPTGRGFGAGPGQFMAEAGAASVRELVPAAEAWQGWGTALKPAWEPIVLARKPLIGTVAKNVLSYGTGALNIDGCRVPTDENLNGGAYAREGGRTESQSLHGGSGMNQPGKTVGTDFVQPAGRWPANLIHDGSDEVLAAFPDLGKAGKHVGRNRDGEVHNEIYGARRVQAVDAGYNDAGSAARFFYCAKASKKDRGEGNTHPTVKPTDLMRYLCRLVTPAGGIVLDPFMGSGSTGKAATLEGFQFVGIDREPAYVAIAEARIAAAA